MCENVEEKINHQMKLSEIVLKCNPDLPQAFKSKFEIMSTNSHFATNVCVVIYDTINCGFNIKLSSETV